MEKNVGLLKIDDAASKFEIFEDAAALLGFARISKEREKRDLEMQKVLPPDSPRLRGMENQVILEKEVDGYTIRVVTTYDPIRKGFTKNGKFWVRIVTYNTVKERESGVFTWKTTRVNDFLSRAYLMMDFLVFALEHRPADEKGILMKLESRVGYLRHHPCVWVGERKNGDVWELTTFCINLPNPNKKKWIGVPNFIDKWIYDVWYYETRRRILNDYKRRERDIRKPYTVKKEIAA